MEKKKAIAAGDLDVTAKELNSNITTLEGLRRACPKKAQESAVKSRKEELKALAKAKKVISETVSGADSKRESHLILAK